MRWTHRRAAAHPERHHAADGVVAVESEQRVAVSIDRPVALADYPGDSVLGIDDEREDSTLLGTGFALRLSPG